jgi:short-subunit dehydrogenase
MGYRAGSCYTQAVNVSTGSSRDLLIIGGTSSLGDAIIAQADINKLTYLATFRGSAPQSQHPEDFKSLDLASRSNIESFLESISNFKFKTIIYCVGSTSGIRLDSMKMSELEDYFRVQSVNAMYLIGKLCERLDDDSTSTFAAISSRAAIYPSFDFCYAASKGALTSFVSSLSKQLPSNKKTIVLAPGALINSRMFNEMPALVQNSHLERSRGSLLTARQAAELILHILNSDIESGSVIEIGPSYK